MIRNIILSVLLCAAAAELSAQSLGSFRERLGEPAAGAAVCVTVHGDASEALARAGRSHSRLRFRGYRVCIFFDNGQNARKGAEVEMDPEAEARGEDTMLEFAIALLNSTAEDDSESRSVIWEQ